MAFRMSVADLIAADKSGLLAKHPSWERVALADVAEILNGAPFDSAFFNDRNGIPLARIRDILSGKSETYYSGDYEQDFILSQGDLLIGMDGDFNCAYWGPQKALLNQRVCKLNPNADLFDKAFLGHLLPGYLAAINEETPSVTVKHLSSKTVGEIDLPLPPRKEQTRIVTKLEELLSDLDAGVAELKAAQKKLALYRQSLLKAAVQGALTADWRARHPPTETGAALLQRILTERRARWEAKQLAKFADQGKAPPKDWQKKYPEPVAVDVAGLPGLPQGWVWASVDQLAEVGTGVTPLRSKPHYFAGGTIPWVTSGALHAEFVERASELVTDTALKECRLETYPAGSLLVAMYGEGKTRGKCSELIFAATINQAIAALVFDGTADSCKKFVKAFLHRSYDDMRKQASGGAQPNLNLQIIRSIAIPLPPLTEQAQISDLLAAQTSEIAEATKAVQRGLAQSTAQRQNILRAAFSGQLVPQDPADEPASVLLERIRVQRLAKGAASSVRRRRVSASP